VVQASVLSHYLHSRGYGNYSFVLAVIGVSAVLTDMGLGLVTVRRLSQDDRHERSHTLSGVLAAKVYLAVLALLATDIFALTARMDQVERHGIYLMSVLYLVSVPAAVSSIFQTELELKYPVVISTIQAVLGLSLTIVLVHLKSSLPAFFAMQLGTALLAAFTIYIVAILRYRVAFSLDFQLGARIVREAIPVGISQVLVVLYFRIDSILLGILRGPVSVAHYTAAYRFVDLGGFAASAFMGSMYPLMVRLGSESDRERLKYVFQRTTDILIFAALPLCVAWIILAHSIVFLVYPGDFGPSVGALRILSLVFVPLFLNNALGPLVLTLHKEKTFLWVSVGATLLNVGLNLAFIPAYGITAAAVITVVSEAFVTVLGFGIMWRVLHFVPSVRSSLLTLLAVTAMALPVFILRDHWIAATGVGFVSYVGVSRALGLWTPGEVLTAIGVRS